MVKKRGKASSTAINNTNKILIDNFVQLQKVMTNLAERFDILSDNISHLLHLFEVSAKSFEQKQDLGKEKEFLEKLDNISKQNRTIAKGLTLMEDRLNHPHQEPRKPRLPRF